MTSKLDNGQLSPQRSPDFAWPLWPVVPLYPYGQRRTLRQEVLKNTIWTFEQLQGTLYVAVPIRMTVIRLEETGLFIYAPVAPTPECLRLVQELVDQYGEVKYIILPTVSGIEHKVFAGPFARQFPTAQVFVSPSQWSFPLNLPLSWLGLPLGRTQLLPEDSREAPFAAELDYTILGPINLGLGQFEEVTFFHRKSRTVLITDAIVAIPDKPPELLEQEPYPLFFHARDNAFEEVQDSRETRLKGWRRICLFAFYFRPQALDVTGWGKTFQDASQSPDRSQKAYFGLFPVQWQVNWKQSFDALFRKGRLFVAPILQALIFNRDPQKVVDWVNQVTSWKFKRIIPCHFASPLSVKPEQLRQAFTFLQQNPKGKSYPLPEEEFQVLSAFDKILTKWRITPPAKDKL